MHNILNNMIRTHEGSSKKGKVTQSTTQPSVAQKKGLKRKAPRHRKKTITLTVSEVSTKRSKNNAVVIDEVEHHDTANAMDVVLSDDGNNDKEEGTNFFERQRAYTKKNTLRRVKKQELTEPRKASNNNHSGTR